MKEVVAVNRVIQFLRTTPYSMFLANHVQTQFKDEMAEKINKKKHRLDENAIEKSNKKRRLSEELNELFDDDDDDESV